MAVRWIIHYSSGASSPALSASEVRDLLRAGRVDAFDLVSREGRPDQKFELVEVDEIFSQQELPAEAPEPERKQINAAEELPPPLELKPKPLPAEAKTKPLKLESFRGPVSDRPSAFGKLEATKVQLERPSAQPAKASGPAEKAQEFRSPPRAQISNKPNPSREKIAEQSTEPPSLFSQEVQAPSPTATFLQKKSVQLPAPTQAPRPNEGPLANTFGDEDFKKSRIRKRGRRYTLYDKTRKPLGPLTAAEVQSLYARGMLDRSVRVSKDSGAQNIPIQQFVAAYTNERSKQAKKEKARSDLDGGAKGRKGGLPSSKILDEMVRSQIIKTSKENYVPIVLIVSVMLFVGVLGWGGYVISADRELRENLIEFFSPSQTFIDLEEVMQPAPPPPQVEKKKVATKAARIEPRKPKPARVVKPEPVRAPPERASRPEPSPPPPPRRPEPSPRSSTPVKPIVRAPRLTPPPAPKIVVPRAPSVRSLDSQVGETVTLSGLTYSLLELENCQLKCSLNLRDGSGKTLTAKFFKGAYEEALVSANGRITVRGRLAKEGASFVIYPQSMN